MQLNLNSETRLHRLKLFLRRYEALIFLLLLGFFLRMAWIHAMIERDEGLFGIQGKLLLEQGPDSFGTNKPPLLTLTYGIIGEIFGNSILPIRLFNNLLFMISIIILYNLLIKAYDRKTAFLSTLFYCLLMNLPIFEGMLAMSESLSMLPIIMSFYYFYKYEQKENRIFLFLALIFASIAFLLKFSNIFILFAFMILLAFNKKINVKQAFLMILIYISIPIIIHFSSLFFTGKSYYWGIGRSLIRFFSTHLSNYVPLNFVIFLLSEVSFFAFLMIIGLIQLFLRHNEKTSIKQEDRIFLAWLIFGLLVCIIPPAFGHYFLVIVPAIALFSAKGIIFLFNIRNNTMKIILLIINFFLLFVTVFFALHQYPDYNINYKIFHFPYSDFSSRDEQMQVINFVKEHTNITDRIMVYGWDGEVYWLSGRTPFKILRFVCYDRSDSILSGIDHDALLEWWNPKLLIVMPQYPLNCNGKNLFSSFISNSSLYKIGNIKIYEK